MTQWPLLLALGGMLLALMLLLHRQGANARQTAWNTAKRQFWMVLPRLPPALLAAECALRLLPEGALGQWLGDGSGVGGLVMATSIGVIVPGGPAVALPIAWALLSGGASPSVVVAFVTAWSLIAVHRAMLFEWPLHGPHWTLRRHLISLPLPLLVGALAGGVYRLGSG